MLDTHCHIDLYKNPAKVVERCESKRIYTIAVTNAPSVFPGTEMLTAGKRYVRPAVGIHPELAEERQGELPLMWEALTRTRYVGEVGLDYSVSESNRTVQRRVFSDVLQQCNDLGGKILTVHSRRAADDVVSAIGAGFNGRVILHWYSGSLKALRRGAESGFYFSINPQMATGGRFRKLLEEIPRDRVLLESDGPFTVVEGRPTTPEDMSRVVKRIAAAWSRPLAEVEAVLWSNFRRLLRTDSRDPGGAEVNGEEGAAG